MPAPSGTVTETPPALAERMLTGAVGAPSSLGAGALRTLAWALKDLCYSAWSTEPQRAPQAAAAIRSLLAMDTLEAQDRDEIGALSQWTAGIAYLTQGEMADALRCLDCAAAAFTGLGKSYEAAQTQVPKIMALTMLGRHAEAVSSAECARGAFIQHGDERAAAKVSLNLGSLHLRRDSFAEAARNYRSAAVLFARAGDHEHSIMADIGIADALTARGEFDEASRIYARAGMRAAAHGFPVLQAMQAESVALLELARGHYRNALAGFETSRSAYETLGMPQHLAIAEKQLADAYLELRLVPEALGMYDLAVARFEAQEMPDDLAWTFAQRGRAQALSGRIDAAIESLDRAEGMFVQQRNAVGEAAVALARGELALSTGVVEALAHASRAAQGFSAAGLLERELRSQAVRADALLKAGATAQARELFGAVLDRARDLQVLPVQIRCLTGQGMVALAMQDRPTALVALNAAVDLFEQERRALPGDDIRSAFLTDHLRPYRELLRIAAQDHERIRGSDTAADVLIQLERFRARALAERLTHRDDVEEDACARDLRARVNWLHRRIQRLHDEGGDAATLVGELRSAERSLLERARRQRLVTQAASSSLPTADDDFRIESLRGRLEEGDALVEFGVLDDELLACVVTRRHVVVHRMVARWPDVIDEVRSARFQLEALRHGRAPVARHLETLAQRAQARMRRLHALIWAPLAASLGDIHRVLIVPHAQLGSVPFAALHDGSRYLAEAIDLTVVPSARVALWGLSRAPAPPRRSLVVGVARELPNAEREASFVASLFPGTRAILGVGATLDVFDAQCGEADVIHLACHAQFRTDNPMFSALHLHDGLLTADRVERLRLRPAIVVLSACETGLAQESTGDEMFGLVRAFLVAGAARVLASLWPVDDEATATMMTRFYAALHGGTTPAAALRAAQLELLRERLHPFYWSAFTLYGGW